MPLYFDCCVANISHRTGTNKRRTHARTDCLTIGRKPSFEPVEENYYILTATLRKTRRANVFPFKIAVGDAVGQCELVIPQMTGFTGYYWAHFAKAAEVERRQSASVTTLDELYRSRVISHLIS